MPSTAPCVPGQCCHIFNRGNNREDRALDAAVCAAYGWPADLAADEILARLLALNLGRAAGASRPNRS